MYITAVENVRKTIIETIASKYALEMTKSRYISGKVVIEIIKTKKMNAREALPIFFTNMYRTTSTLLINGPQVGDLCKKYYQYYNMGISERKGNRHMWPTFWKDVKKVISK